MPARIRHTRRCTRSGDPTARTPARGGYEAFALPCVAWRPPGVSGARRTGCPEAVHAAGRRWSAARRVGLDRHVPRLRADPVEPVADPWSDGEADVRRALRVREQRDVGDPVALAGEPGGPGLAEVALHHVERCLAALL